MIQPMHHPYPKSRSAGGMHAADGGQEPYVVTYDDAAAHEINRSIIAGYVIGMCLQGVMMVMLFCLGALQMVFLDSIASGLLFYMLGGFAFISITIYAMGMEKQMRGGLERKTGLSSRGPLLVMEPDCVHVCTAGGVLQRYSWDAIALHIPPQKRREKPILELTVAGRTMCLAAGALNRPREQVIAASAHMRSAGLSTAPR